MNETPARTVDSAQNISDVDHDELNLRALFQAIWRTRQLVASAAILGALTVAGIIIFSKLAVPSTQTFQYALQFSFPGADKNQYPNQTPFLRADVVAPTILQRVYQDNGLDQFNISRRGFSSSIAIYPYSPNYGLVVARFRQRLSNKKLTFGIRKRIEETMRDELDALTKRNAVLRMTVESRLGIQPDLGEKLLHDIAREWARFSIKTRGVLMLPDAQGEGMLVEPFELKGLDCIVAVEVLADAVSLLSSRLARLRESAAAEGVIDKKSGKTAATLARQLIGFQRNRLDALLSRIITGSHIADKEQVLTLLNFRADRLQLAHDERETIAEAIGTSLNLYQQNTTFRRSSAAQPRTPSSQLPSGQGSTVAQLDANILDRLIYIKKQQADFGFRQNLIDRLINARNATIKPLTSMKRIRSLILKIESVNATSITSDGQASKKIVAKVQEYAAKINDYGIIAARLFQATAAHQLSRDGGLYVGLELPADEALKTSHPIFNRRSYLIVFLAAVASAILALFGGLVWQMMRGRPST